MKMEMEMTLDEAILHCEEVADRCDNRECANEHRQLAEWLKELKERRASELSSANLQPNLQPTCNLASNDCISRQAAISETMWNMSDSPSITKYDWSAIIEGLKALPSAQPEPCEVRCKDCKYYIKSESYCDYLGITISDLDFCSLAGRRTDGSY